MNSPPQVWEVSQALISIAFALFFLENLTRSTPKQVKIFSTVGLVGIFAFWIVPVIGNWRLLVFRPASGALTAFCLSSWIVAYIFRGRLAVQGIVWMALGLCGTVVLPKGISNPAQLQGTPQVLFTVSVYMMWMGLGSVIISSGVKLYILFEDRNRPPSDGQPASK
jgi:hypothetical protein